MAQQDNALPDDSTLDQLAHQRAIERNLPYGQALSDVIDDLRIGALKTADERPQFAEAGAGKPASLDDFGLHELAVRHKAAHAVSYEQALREVRSQSLRYGTPAGERRGHIDDADLHRKAMAYVDKHHTAYADALAMVRDELVQFAEGGGADIVKRVQSMLIPLIKAGRSDDRSAHTLSREDIAMTARAYKASVFEAPVIVGQGLDTSPALAMVKSLEVQNGDTLMMRIGDVDSEFAAALLAGQLRTPFVEFYEPTSPANPAPGAWSLRRVGWRNGPSGITDLSLEDLKARSRGR